MRSGDDWCCNVVNKGSCDNEGVAAQKTSSHCFHALGREEKIDSGTSRRLDGVSMPVRSSVRLECNRWAKTAGHRQKTPCFPDNPLNLRQLLLLLFSHDTSVLPLGGCNKCNYAENAGKGLYFLHRPTGITFGRMRIDFTKVAALVALLWLFVPESGIGELKIAKWNDISRGTQEFANRNAGKGGFCCGIGFVEFLMQWAQVSM